MLQQVCNISRFYKIGNVINNLGLRSALVKDHKCRYSMHMNEDSNIFHTYNKPNRNHATLYLEEYAPKFRWNENNIRVLDIGSGDGSVTTLLNNYIPKNYEVLMGCDMSENMVKFANDKYSNDRTKFIKLDIEQDLPKEFENKFDFIFSNYVFNWVRKQQVAFTNVYKLLKNEGECFLLFAAYTQAFVIFLELAKTNKWGPYLKNVNDMVSPYYKTQNPEKIITETLKNIGFQQIDVRCKQTFYEYQGDELKNFTSAINPFRFPDESMSKDLINDFVQLAKDIKLYDKSNDTYTFNYNIMAVHCRK